MRRVVTTEYLSLSTRAAFIDENVKTAELRLAIDRYRS